MLLGRAPSLEAQLPGAAGCASTCSGGTSSIGGSPIRTVDDHPDALVYVPQQHSEGLCASLQASFYAAVYCLLRVSAQDLCLSKTPWGQASLAACGVTVAGMPYCWTVQKPISGQSARRHGQRVPVRRRARLGQSGVEFRAGTLKCNEGP